MFYTKLIALWKTLENTFLSESSKKACDLRLLPFQLSAKIILLSTLWYGGVKSHGQLTLGTSGFATQFTAEMTLSSEKGTCSGAPSTYDVVTLLMNLLVSNDFLKVYKLAINDK